MNNVKVFTLMAALTGLLVALGSYFGGQGGMVTMLVVSALIYVFTSVLPGDIAERVLARLEAGFDLVGVARAEPSGLLLRCVSRLRLPGGTPLPFRRLQ